MATSKKTLQLDAAREELRAGAARIAEDPQTNSVFALARSLFLRLEAGETDLGALEALVDEVHLSLAQERAAAFRAQHFDVKPQAIWTEVRAQVQARAGEGWEAFRSAMETPAGGIVFTAHPTFAMPKEARAALAAEAEKPGAASRKTLAKALKADARGWSASISLEGEHEETQGAIANAQGAMTEYARLVFDEARKAFPETWRHLRPALPTLASWVGYDLDGRSDINWWQSVSLRLSEKAEQLTRYADRIAAIDGDETLAALQERLRKAAALSREESALFARDLSDPGNLIVAAEHLSGEQEGRLTDAREIIEAIDTALSLASAEAAQELCVLRAEVEALQLGTARIHLRVNAAQVRAVISRDLGLETEDRDLGRLALQQLSQKAAERGTREANLAELFLERSTARRQIMMCALWLKYIDAGSPIRFLIAEAENPATVMGTLYLARQYGIDGMLDISPLFETPEALETGGRFIARLLEEPEFLAYLRSRGHMCVQLGFSDAGRFIGQVAADMAIERIHNLIARALSEKAPGIGLLIFNTHGESMGRGAWPGSFEQRFDHLLTCWTRGQARQRGLRLMHESSFQGGDGFLHFATPALAETSYGAWCRHLLSDPAECLDDPFYHETDFVWDTYRSLRSWHERLFAEPDYGHLLGDFAGNFLVRAGSRQKRRTGGPKGPRSLRAISHNATLQQLGVPVNTAAGLGSAIRRENERLISLLNRSPRMRSLLHLALRARVLTTLPGLRAYGQVYDPSFWVAVSRHAEGETGAAYRRVYYSLKEGETFQSIRRIADRFSIDLGKFDRLLAALDDAPSAEERHEGRLDLHVLHAVRQALMMHALALSGRLPTLSGRLDADLDDFMKLVREMEVGEAARLLEEAFPQSAEVSERLARIAGPQVGELSHGYDALHRQIVTPLKTIHALFHKSTLAIAQAYRAFG